MNILSAIRDQFSPELLGQISKSVGESPEATKNAMDNMLPALLGSAAAKASSPEGAAGLFDLLKEKTPQGGWASSATSLLGNLTGDGRGIGSSLINFLLGSKANMLRDFLVSRSGIRSESASTLLGTGGHLLTGFLGNQIASQGLGASDFGQLLRSQIPHLQGLIPSELSGMLGLGNLLSSGKKVASAATSYDTPYVAVRETVERTGASASKVLRWALVPLALLLLAAVFMVNRHNRQENVGTSADYTWTNRGVGTNAIELPRIDTTGLTDRLKTAIASSDGTPIDLSGVNFDSAGTLSTTAKTSLASLGKMITDNQSLKVKIIAYGKDPEEAANRANTIRSWLVGTGIAGERIAVQPELGEGIPKVSFTK